jgi:hypothetical protein
MAINGADESKPIARPSRKPFVPDGIVFHRRAIRRRGNLVAVVIMVATTVVGLLWSRTVDGAAGGLGGFAILTLAMPFLPIFGAPTAGNSMRYFLAFILSLALWAGLGVFATRRTLMRPIATWREWTFSFVPLALAVFGGVGAGLLITAISVL